MQPQDEKVINGLSAQLATATRLRDRKKMADLQEALDQYQAHMENRSLPMPDLSRFGIDVVGSTGTPKSQTEEVPPPLHQDESSASTVGESNLKAAEDDAVDAKWRSELDVFNSVSDHAIKRRIIEELRVPYDQGLFSEELQTQFIMADSEIKEVCEKDALLCSKMKRGDLQVKHRVVEELTSLAVSTEHVFDGREFRDTTQLVDEARTLWESNSRGSVDALIQLVTPIKDSDPDKAMMLLRDQAGKPGERSEKRSWFVADDLARIDALYNELSAKSSGGKEPASAEKDSSEPIEIAETPQGEPAQSHEENVAPGHNGRVVTLLQGRLKDYTRDIPEDVASMTNELLKNSIQTLGELQEGRSSHPDIEDDERDRLSEIISTLISEKQTRLNNAYTIIGRKIEDGKLDQATAIIHEALTLSEQDPKLQAFLQRCVTGSITDKEVRSWQLALDEFNSVGDHAEKKRIIDRLRIPFREGRFPDELNGRFLEAQENLEHLRRNSSLITSRMRLGKLADKKKAFEEFQTLTNSTATVFDGTADVNIAAQLADSEKLWSDESRLDMNSVFDGANTYIDSEPDTALSVLVERVGRPKEASDKRSLYTKEDLTRFDEFYAKIEREANKLEEARRLVNEGELGTDSYAKLLNLVKARSIFKKYKDIDELIKTEIPAAGKDLINRISNLIERAKTQAGIRRYYSAEDSASTEDSVERCLQSAQTLIDQWTRASIPLPANVAAKQEELEKITKDLREQGTRYVTLMKRLGDIENQATTGNTQKTVAELEQDLKELEKDLLFKEFKAEFKKTTDKLNGLKSIDEQVAVVQKQSLEEDPDWDSIHDMTTSLLKRVDNASPLVPTIAAIHLKAELHVGIAHVKMFVFNKNIIAAEEEMAKIPGIETQEVKDQLKPEIEIMTEARANTSAMETLMIHARKVFSGGSPKDIFHAYQLYRYIGGYPIKVEDEPSLPPYRLSRVTAAAMTNAKEIEKYLFRYLEEVKKAKSNGFAPSQLRTLYDYAAYFRKANLLASDKDQQLCDWIEEEYLASEEQRLIGEGKFDDVIKMWTEVKEHAYVLRERRLLNARVIWAIKNSNSLCNTGKFEESLQTLLPLKEQASGDPRYDMALSETYRRLEKYDEGIATLNHNPRVPTIDRTVEAWTDEYRHRREWLYVQKRIHEFDVRLKEQCAIISAANESYKPSETAIRINSVEKIVEAADKYLNVLMRVVKDKEVVEDNEFNQIRSLYQQNNIEILKKIYESEDKIDPASALNMLISLWSIHTGFTTGKDTAAAAAKTEAEWPTVKDYIQAHPKLVDQVVDQISLREPVGRVGQLLVQYRLWLMNLKGFLEVDGLRADRTKFMQLKDSLREEYSKYYNLEINLDSLRKDQYWKDSTENYQPDIPLPIDAKIETVRAFDLSGILDVSELFRKYVSWKTGLAYLAAVVEEFNDKINSVESSVISAEVINRTIKERIAELRRPESLKAAILNELRKPDSSTPEYQDCTLTLDELKNMYEWFSPKVYLFYGPEHYEARGWVEVKKAAETALDNLVKWQAWETDFGSAWQNIIDLKKIKTCIAKPLPFEYDEKLVRKIAEDISLTYPTRTNLQFWSTAEVFARWSSDHPAVLNDKNESVSFSQQMTAIVPLRYRIYTLQDYAGIIEKAIEFFQAGPDKKGIDKFLQLTNFSKLILGQCEKLVKELESLVVAVHQDITNAETEITRLGNYPTREELKSKNDAGVSARKMLEMRIQAAEKIGPQDKKEFDDYNYYYPIVYPPVKKQEPTTVKKVDGKKSKLDDIIDKAKHDLGL